MEVGIITKPNIFNPVVIFFHLIVKPFAHFHPGQFILCSQFLFYLNLIRKKFQIQFQYTDCAIWLRPNSWHCCQQDFFRFWAVDKPTASTFCWVLAPLVQPDLPLLILCTVLSVWNVFIIPHVVFLSEAILTAKYFWYWRWVWTVHLVSIENSSIFTFCLIVSGILIRSASNNIRRNSHVYIYYAWKKNRSPINHYKVAFRSFCGVVFGTHCIFLGVC